MLKKIISLIIITLLVVSCVHKGYFDKSKPNLSKYPQDTPAKALSSVILSIESNDTKYFINHLQDPDEIKILISEDKFDEFVKSTTEYMRNSLHIFIKFQNPKIEIIRIDDRADLMLSENKQIILRKIGKRWFFKILYYEE